jgi:hypothetical protein
VADTKAAPCWVLTNPRRRSGRVGSVHYASAVKAAEATARPHSPVAGWVPQRLDERCLTVSCRCGYVLDENADGVVHLPAGEVGVALAACGWVRDGDGWRCPECVAGVSRPGGDASACAPGAPLAASGGDSAPV